MSIPEVWIQPLLHSSPLVPLSSLRQPDTTAAVGWGPEATGWDGPRLVLVGRCWWCAPLCPHRGAQSFSASDGMSRALVITTLHLGPPPTAAMDHVRVSRWGSMMGNPLFDLPSESHPLRSWPLSEEPEAAWY
jgi:hypothetical protein